jgi:hypothetical protein
VLENGLPLALYHALVTQKRRSYFFLKKHQRLVHFNILEHTMKPSTLPGDPFDHLPALQELQQHPHWVLWKYEERDGKPTKVPYNAATRKRAAADNPATWTSYATARAVLTRFSDRYDGLGFVFDSDTIPLTGVDLDHCVNPNGSIDAWAQEILDQLASYAEYSPSATGIHVYIQGTVSHGFRKKVPSASHAEAAVEAYSSGRYFTVTGQHVPGTPEMIADGADALAAIYEQFNPPRSAKKELPQPHQARAERLSDELVLEKARTAKNGERFWRLWNGDTSEYLSASEADAALCAMLAFWTGKDEKRIDRLFRQSKLYRPDKWDRKARSGETYGAGTIARAIAQCEEVYDPDRRHPERKDGLPDIITGGEQLRDVTDQAVAALVAAHQDRPLLFLQSARLVHVGRDELKRPLLTQMDVPELKEALTHAANFYRLRKVPGQTDTYEKVPVSPPRELAEQILARQTQSPYLPFLPLDAIVETPVMRPDGTILNAPGYDTVTRLYYAPEESMATCTIPLAPTRAEQQAALDLIWSAIGEFCYATAADRANALGLLLTPLVRPAIKRHILLALLDAPKPGTGKGLLADVISIIATGKSTAILTMPKNEEEWEKRITALLLQGRTIITIDNVKDALYSSALEAVLTADIHEGRVLGQSTMVKVPHRAIWIATGNNIKLGGDLPRRCYRIRLDPHVSQPWMRSGFTHEDLAEWTRAHRGDLISALLTLARAWYATGQPMAPGIPMLGTFSGWAKLIGSILAHAGVEGFLGNLDTLYANVDEEATQWESFLQTWHATFGSEWVPVVQITERIQSLEPVAGGSPGQHLAEILPEFLQIALKDRPNSFKIRLAKALEKRVDTCFGPDNLHLEHMLDKHSKIGLWRVMRGVAGHRNTPLYRENGNSTINKYNNRIVGLSDPQPPAVTKGETRSMLFPGGMDPLLPGQETMQNGAMVPQPPANGHNRGMPPSLDLTLD